MNLRTTTQLCILAATLASVGRAQVDARRVEYEVQHTDIQLSLRPAESSFSAIATLRITNTGNTAGTSVTLFVSKEAKVSAASVNGASAHFETSEGGRFPSLINLRVTPPASIGANQTAEVRVSYSLTVQESTPQLAVNPGESVLLPEAHWYPTINTPFWTKGMDFAPFRLTVNTSGERPWAPGKAVWSADYSAASSTTFEMSSKSLPVVLTTRPRVLTMDGPADSVVPIDAEISEGIVGDPKAQVQRIFGEAKRMLQFQAEVFGKPPSTLVHIVFSPRTGGYGVPGFVILSEDLLRRDFLDASTMQELFVALSRNWIGGLVRPVDPGWPTFYDGLPRFLAAKYYRERFGEAAEHEAFARFSRAYAGLAATRKDSSLLLRRPGDQDYTVSAFNKGPLVFRIFDRVAGNSPLMAAIKAMVSSSADGTISVESLKKQLHAAEKPEIASVIHQWIEMIVDPDLLVGLPQQQADGWAVAVRNFGTGDLTVDVLAVTESGKRLIQQAALTEANGRYQVVKFATAEKVVSTEVDPDKVWVQINYDNDTRPVRLSANTLFEQGLTAMRADSFADAKTKFEQAAKADPGNSQALAWLGRAQALGGDAAGAQDTIKRAMAITPTLRTTATWCNITLGDIATSHKDYEAAANYYTKAIQALDEFPAALLAYAGRRRAESASGKLPPIDPSIKSFLAKLDSAIMTGKAANVRALVSNTDLRKFASGIEIQKPGLWKTEPLRVDQLDADCVSVEVELTIRAKTESQGGTAVLLLKRNGSDWLFEKVSYLDVK